MSARSDSPPWHVPVTVEDVPETGRHLVLEPDSSVRQAVGDLAGVRELPELRAEFDLSRHGGDGLRVTGRVSAVAGQTCVVTLEPILNRVDEAIDLVFKPPHRLAEVAAPAESVLEAANDDAPEPLDNGTVDLGALATEFLLLGIDPYPRKPGVAFEPPNPPKDPSEHPFAALAALKNRNRESRD